MSTAAMNAMMVGVDGLDGLDGILDVLDGMSAGGVGKSVESEGQHVYEDVMPYELHRSAERRVAMESMKGAYLSMYPDVDAFCAGKSAIMKSIVYHIRKKEEREDGFEGGDVYRFVRRQQWLFDASKSEREQSAEMFEEMIGVFYGLAAAEEYRRKAREEDRRKQLEIVAWWKKSLGEVQRVLEEMTARDVAQDLSVLQGTMEMLVAGSDAATKKRLWTMSAAAGLSEGGESEAVGGGDVKRCKVAAAAAGEDNEVATVV